MDSTENILESDSIINHFDAGHSRLKREAFYFLLERVEPLLKSKSTSKETIDPKTQLLITIWILSTPDSYRNTEKQFESQPTSCVNKDKKNMQESPNNKEEYDPDYPDMTFDCDVQIEEDLKSASHFLPNSLDDINLTSENQPVKKKKKNSNSRPDTLICSCGFKARSTYSLNRHLITHQTDDEVIWYDCDKCSFKTKHKDSLRAHYKNIHIFVANKVATDGVFRCDECDFSARNRITYKKHLEEHMDKSLFFSCDQCDYQTRRKKNLRAHALKHKPPEEIALHQCPQCDFTTKYKSSIHSHILIHYDPNPSPTRRLKIDEDTRATFKFKCSQCDYRGKTKGMVDNHQYVHMADESKMISCEVKGCNFKTARKHVMKRHNLIHKTDEEVTWFQCYDCSFKTRHKGSLKNHVIAHKSPAEYTDYACEHCTYTTKWKNCFKRHVLLHIKTGTNH